MSSRACEASLRLARVMLGSRANGPCTRDVYWAAGCSIRCAGCVNAHLWSPTAGIETPVASLRALIDERAPSVEGVTFTGGEPTEQAEGFLELARHARERGLGVVMFTGRTARALSRDARLRALRDTCDLVVSGPFQAWRSIQAPLLASANQRLIFVSRRYSTQDLLEIPAVELVAGPRRLALTGLGLGSQPTPSSRRSRLLLLRSKQR